jgi:hypothetical protein
VNKLIINELSHGLVLTGVGSCIAVLARLEYFAIQELISRKWMRDGKWPKFNVDPVICPNS